MAAVTVMPGGCLTPGKEDGSEDHAVHDLLLPVVDATLALGGFGV